MKFILTLSNWYHDWGLDNKAAIEADKLGFWGIAMPDHYLWAESMDDATLDTWIALNHLAAKTTHIHVGTMVTPIPFRPPAIIAKMVSTIDIISNGRTFLGVGAGWSQREFEAYSEWDEPKVRVSKVEEGIRLIKRLWTEEKVEFQGKFYHAKGGILEPKPIQKPHPPLLFGGFSPRMLKLAGKYGDIVYLPASWTKMSFEEAKNLVFDAAEKSGRTTKISLAAASPTNRNERSPPKYDRQRFQNAVLEAEKNGCEYFILSLPQIELLGSMNDFAKNIMVLG